MNSIQQRLALVSALVLVVFLSLTGLFLERTYRASVVMGAQQQLKPVIYSLLGAAQERRGALDFTDGLSQPRLQQPDSGLFALVTNSSDGELWRSPSLAMAVESSTQSMLVLSRQAQEGETGIFVFADSQGEVDLYCLSYKVEWDGLQEPLVTFTVCNDQAPFQDMLQRFRYGLAAGFGSLLLLLSLALILALRWGLRPLRLIQGQVEELEQGDRHQLDSVQPAELDPLVTSLNHYVLHQSALRKSHRQALDDLAHSLKTPLSVLQLEVNSPTPDGVLLQEQVDRMQAIVDSQLSRIARVTQLDGVGDQGWVAVSPVIEQLVRALRVVYPQHQFEVSSEESWALRIHEDDLLDMLGNLMENACKYGAGKVRVTVASSAEQGVSATRSMQELQVWVEDNGPGIDPRLAEQALSRGMRLDLQTPGQGIGLAMVVELLSVYAGRIRSQVSELGGAKFTLTFAQARVQSATPGD